MSVTRRLGAARRAGLSPMVAIDEKSVRADVPVAGPNGGLSCRLRVDYSIADPLVVSLVVQAPSGATVTEATVLRGDFAASLSCDTLSLGSLATATDGRQVQLVFAEGSARFGVALPKDLIEDFLNATRTLVGTDDRSEAAACSAAAAKLLDELLGGGREAMHYAS